MNLSEGLIKDGHEVTAAVKEGAVAYQLNSKLRVMCSDRVQHFWPSVLLPVANYLHRYKITRAVINDTKPDVIIASWGSDLLYVLMLHGDIPIVSSEHNTFDRHHKPMEYVDRFWLNRFFDKVVVLTKYDKAFMARKLKNTLVIANPLSFHPLTETEYEQSFHERRNILACGRLNAYHTKGFDTLIRCFASIADRHPGWDLDIAGTGSEKDVQRLESLAKEKGVEARVHLIGFHSDIADVMKRHSIFALSSRSEGFGMVVTEAMAMGCACISFDLTGPGEIIVDGIDGVLVEDQNEDAFAVALSKLMDDDKTRISMGRRAIEDVNRFSAEKITAKWEKMFKTLSAEGSKLTPAGRIKKLIKNVIAMIKRLLFDMEATQPNGAGKRHGGGKYGEIVLERIVERGLPVAVFFNSKKWFNPEMEELLKSHGIQTFDVSEHNLEEIIRDYEAEVLYTPLLSDKTEKVESCKVIATQHGLRGYELPIDLMKLRYKSQFNVREIARSMVLNLFPSLNRKRIDGLRRKSVLMKGNVDFVTVSEHSAYSIKTYFPEIDFDTQKKVFYSPSTVKEQKFERKYDERYFLLVSGNRWEKNNLRAIMALDRLYCQHQIDGFEVMVTGAKSPKEYRYTIKNPEHFHFLGYVEDDELAQLYHDAYCLVYPSLNEGFGYPPLEAMSQGVPVISSSFSSIQEVCQDAALYTNPFSVDEIMTRILMMTTASIRNYYSMKGLNRYAKVVERQKADLDKLIDYIYKI